jgi:hypothetical protein
MTAISSQLLVRAVLAVDGMTFQEREQLADAVYARQPNLLASIIVLKVYGATLEQMEVVLNILLVFYAAMKASGLHWPLISEDDQERCLKRVTGRIRFTEGLSPALQKKATTDAIADHTEQQLLAYVYGKFKENGLLGIETEAEKMMLLAALNLVECIGDLAPRQRR